MRRTPASSTATWLRRGAGLLTVLASMLPCPPASAVEVRVCVAASNVPELLWDYSPTKDGRDAGEDFARLDQPGALAIPRMLTRVRSFDGPTLWGWAPVDNAGCTDYFDATVKTLLTVDYFWWSYFEDSDFSVISLSCNDAKNPAHCTSTSMGDPGHVFVEVPAQGGDLLAPLSASRRSFVHFAAAFAEARTHSSYPSSTEYYTLTGITLQTISNRLAGGNLTSSFGGDAYARKFTVAHEYGHLESVLQIPGLSGKDVDYCHGDPANCSLTHTQWSPEWQAAAMIEGYAHFFAMYVWNDINAVPRDAVAIWADGGDVWECRYRPDPDPDAPLAALPAACLPDDSPLTMVADSWHHQINCQPDECPAGVATGSDWAFALWDMLLLSSASLPVLLEIPLLAHPWPINGHHSDFWNDFITAANTSLSHDDLLTWFAVAEIRGIDR